MISTARGGEKNRLGGGLSQRPIDQETLRIARELNAQRIFVLQPSRLGSKIILSLQERDTRGTVIYEAGLTASWVPLFLLHVRIAF